MTHTTDHELPSDLSARRRAGTLDAMSPVPRRGWTQALRSVLGPLLLLIAGSTLAAASDPPAERGEGSAAAFTGLAMAPEANLFVGSATTGIRIDVPPGRKELTPKLELSYTSSGGPSPYGLGWDLPLGRMQRCSKRGVLSCNDGAQRYEFVLVLPSANVECRLDLAAGARSARPCIPAIQESYIRITYNEDANRWDVWDKSGLHYVLGATVNQRSGSDVTRLFTPGLPCTYTHAWALNHIEDPNGNTLDIVYSNRAGVLHPEQIAYGGNLNVNQPHVFEVSFVWSDEDGFSRPAGDEVLNAIGGFPAMLTRLLSRIDVRYRPDGIGAAAGETIRSYGFLYDFQLALPAAVGRQSLLSAVTIYDGSGRALSRNDGAPASTTFLYQRNAPDNGRFGFGPPQPAARPANNWRLRSIDGANPIRRTTRDLFDINGDGFIDLVDIGSCLYTDTWQVYLGSKEGFATTAVHWWLPDSYGLCAGIRITSAADGDWRTRFDTVDLNGDGLPDLVDASLQPYLVYFGGVLPNNGGGYFNAAQVWPAPDLPLRHSRPGWNLAITVDGASKFWSDGTVDVTDLLDVNGDGLLDLVTTPHMEGSQVHCEWSGASAPACRTLLSLAGKWSVWLNTGSGFASTATEFPAAVPFLRYTSGDGVQAVGLYDLTGDGLLDHVVAHHKTANAWLVYQNTGHSLALGGGDWRAPDECGKTGIHDRDNQRVARDLFDINGDGLPDLVTTCGTTWYVRLGLGSGFAAQPLTWSAPYGYIRDVDDQGDGTYRDTFDIDGDGMADFVDFFRGSLHRNLGGAWSNVCASGTCAADAAHSGLAENLAGAKPNLLVQIENGIGGSTAIDYRPSTVWDNTDANRIPRLPFVLWTATRIAQSDGLCNGDTCRTAGSHTLSTDIAYGYGLYDAQARELRGFRTVRQTDAAGHRRETYFYQDGARKGKMQIGDVYAAGNDLPSARISAQWMCSQSANGPNIFCPDVVAGGDAVSVRLKATFRSDGGSELASDEQRSWDTCGNVTETVKRGLNARSLTTYTSYTCTTASGAPSVVDRPVRSWSVENAGSAAARLLEEKWFTYDALSLGQLTKGNLTKVHSWLDGTIIPALPIGGACPQTPKQGYGSCIATTMGYDSLGNVTLVTDAKGSSTTTIYDAATNIYPDFVTAGSGSARQQTNTLYDPKCGKLRRRSVAYPAAAGAAGQPYTETVYDSFCRPREIWEPFPGGSANVKRRMYGYSQSPPGAVTAPFEVVLMELIAGDPRRSMPQTWLDSYSYFDALGRPLQTKRRAVVDGSTTFVVDGLAERDERGNVVRRYAPFRSFNTLFAPTPPPGTGSTAFAYDALRRVTRVTQPDGSFRTTEYGGAIQTTIKDECYTSGQCAGSETITILDGFGRAVENHIYQKPAGAAATFVTRSATIYDGLGRTVETRQGDAASGWNQATRIVTSYDSLGRKIQLLDPDSGTWMYGYDPVGNLIYQDDPAANQHLQFCYDSLNRITKKHYIDGSDEPYLPYRPSACALDDGQIRYTYGETAGASFGRVIAVDDLSGLSVFHYDVRGRIVSTSQTITVDAVSSVGQFEYTYNESDQPTAIRYPDGELVRYAYDRVGQLKKVKGRRRIINKLTYDLFGRQLQVLHGNRLNDVRAYGDAAQNYRLASLQTRKGRRGIRFAYDYEAYTRSGLLASLRDVGPKGVDEQMDASCTFAYDGVGRLTGVSGARLTAAYTYDGLGNMIAKEGVKFAYSAARPHTLERINGSTVGLAHDPNGNRTGKPGQSYTYTADDRVERISTGAGTVRFVYDYQGRRVAKVEPNGRVTRYYGGLAEAAGEYLTKHYYAGDLLIASNRVWAPQLAAFPGPAMMQTAQLASTTGPGIVLLVLDDVPLPLALSVILIGSSLLLAPWRRKAVVGLRVRHGHVILVTLAFGASTLPLPIVRPAAAASSIPASTTAIGTTTGILHYHLDHLGSVHAITDARGNVVQYIRYKPYGEIRDHYDGLGNRLTAGTCSNDAYCREFTTYDSEPLSGLQYANARVYDPQLGLFLTHDPVRQFASPYTYTNWNPVNATDPTGEELTLLAAIVIGALAGALASGVQAAINGASPGEAFKAAAIGGAMGGLAGGVGFVVLQPAIQSVTSALTSQLIAAGMEQVFASNVATLSVNGSLIAGGIAQAGYNASRGDYTGLIGLSAAYAMAAGWDALVPDGPAREAAITEFDVRPGDIMGTNEGAYARVISVLDPNGDIGHTQMVWENRDGSLAALTSDGGGQRIAQTGDEALSGRGYVIYRARNAPVLVRPEGQPPGLGGWISANANGGGRARYLGYAGGNVCSSTCNSAAVAGGINTGFAPNTFVTPNQLVNSPAFIRVGRLPLVP